MRAKTSVLQEALTGHFTGHHAFMLGMMLARIDALTAQIDTLTTRIERGHRPARPTVAQLDEIPGIGITAAQDLLAEIGTGMSRFPTPGHLVSWAKFAPKPPVRRPQQAAATGKGNPWLGGTLGEAATSAARTKTFLAPATSGSPGAAASNAPWSPSATPSSPSPGTCSRPRRPLHRPRPRLARPPRPATPQTPAHHRTRTPIRQESTLHDTA